jgi:hypothetical protein
VYQKTPTIRWGLAVAGAAMLAVLAYAANATAQWSDRTILSFSESVMVPGATLEPGRYVFRPMGERSNRHTIQILRADDGDEQVIATAQAVPTKRLERAGDPVVLFNPTEGGPPALKGYYPDGSSHGHEFIYSEADARRIAQRAKTVVLSVDVPGTDVMKGTLHVFDASGSRAEWRGDETTTREWEQWQRGRGDSSERSATAAQQKPDREAPEQPREASAPITTTPREAMQVSLDALEDDPRTYIGQTVSVDAEVEDVLGPRMFTIDEPNWADLQGELLVYVPTNLAVLVSEDDRVTITGTVRQFVLAEVEREWGWFGLDSEIEAQFTEKPVLVASRIVGGDDDETMILEVGPSGARAAGYTEVDPITNLSELGDGDEDLVGRLVTIKEARVEAMAEGGGFFVSTPEESVFVLPAQANAGPAKPGGTVTITGVVLEMPGRMEDRLNPPDDFNDDIYVFAQAVTP